MLYIILPVHNRIEVTRKVVACLLKQDYKNFTVLLVDDGSTDGTAEMVQENFPATIVLQGDGNLWWGGSLHKAYLWLLSNASENDHCLTLNDDTLFDDSFLRTGMELLSRNEKTLLCAQVYSRQTQMLDEGGIHFHPLLFTFKPVRSGQVINCLSTRGLFLTFSDFKKIGGFYPKLLPHYLSDYEFTMRAYRKGYTLMTDQSLKLYADDFTTGTHIIAWNGFKDYYKKYFSKRNPRHPFYLMNFILLSVPMPYKLLHIFRPPAKFIWDNCKPFVFSFRSFFDKHKGD